MKHSDRVKLYDLSLNGSLYHVETAIKRDLSIKTPLLPEVKGSTPLLAGKEGVNAATFTFQLTANNLLCLLTA